MLQATTAVAETTVVADIRGLTVFSAIAVVASTRNQVQIYVIDLPGFIALPEFRIPFCGDLQSTLNPVTTVYTRSAQFLL